MNPAEPALLSIRNLVVHYPDREKRRLTAVNDVSFELKAGSFFGLVGESGSGKTSVAHTIAQIIRPSAGQIFFHGQNLATLKARELQKVRRNIQLVFQDPLASLSPRRSVMQSLLEPLNHFRIGNPDMRQAQVLKSLDSVGLEADVLHRYPHELSGGQRQRVALARALVSEPELIIADEIVSSLDVSVQARILHMLLDLRKSTGVAFLFISHDLAVIQQLADVVGVMYLGKMLEIAPANALFQQAAHPYTQSLLDAVPSPDPKHARPVILGGELPSPLTPPSGCVFHTRCDKVMDQCKNKPPPETRIVKQSSGYCAHCVRCHLWNS